MNRSSRKISRMTYDYQQVCPFPLCGRSFRTDGGLAQHIDYIHQDQRIPKQKTTRAAASAKDFQDGIIDFPGNNLNSDDDGIQDAASPEPPGNFSDIEHALGGKPYFDVPHFTEINSMENEHDPFHSFPSQDALWLTYVVKRTRF